MKVDTKIQSVNEAIEKLTSRYMEDELITFPELVSQEKFPLSNVAFSLFMDVVKWFSKSDTRSMRYSDTSMKFFWLEKTMFGSRFLQDTLMILLNIDNINFEQILKTFTLKEW